MTIQKSKTINFDAISANSFIIYDTVAEETHLLNETAGLVFKLCDGRCANTIFSDFAGVFDISNTRELRIDFDEIVEDMVQKNILVATAS